MDSLSGWGMFPLGQKSTLRFVQEKTIKEINKGKQLSIIEVVRERQAPVEGSN